MDLRFQVPMQYCSLQHWTLLLPPDTFTTGCCFSFGLATSFFLYPLFSSKFIGHLPTWGVYFSVSYLFAFSYCSMRFSRQEYSSVLPFPSPGDHILSELSTMTHPSWVALHGMSHSFTEVDVVMSTND